MAKRGSSRRIVVTQLLLGAALLGGSNYLSLATALAARKKAKGGAPATPAEEGKNLKPGQFTWHPERAPSGPVAIIVSVPKQRVYVYRNGILIGVSTCSTGKKGDRGVHHLGESRGALFERVRRCVHATHGAPDLAGRGAARGQAAGLSRLSRLRAPAAQIRDGPLRGDAYRNPGHHRRRSHRSCRCPRPRARSRFGRESGDRRQGRQEGGRGR